MTATVAATPDASASTTVANGSRPAGGPTTPVVSVLVPTYKRVDALAACLRALAAQERPADEVLVTVRDTDAETRAFLAQWAADEGPACRLPLRVVDVVERGVIAAMNAGLAAARPDADIVALTDDDACPRPGWLARIVRIMDATPGVVGVGGRDLLPWDHKEPERDEVGVLRWYGKAVGFHHKGVGPARRVDLLKGVNCAFRAAPLRRVGFDTALRGAGAQVHWEMALCLALTRAGAGTLVYDPALLVDHYPAVRHDNDVNHRGGFDAASLADAIYNETLVLLRELPPARRAAFWAWTNLVGTGFSPGVVQFFRLRLLKKDRDAGAKCRAAFGARREALRDARRRGEGTPQGGSPS